METFIPKGQLTGFIMPRFLNEIDGLSLPAKVLYGALCDHARDKDFCLWQKGLYGNAGKKCKK